MLSWSVLRSAVSGRACARCLPPLQKLNTQGYLTTISILCQKSSSSTSADGKIDLEPSRSAGQRITEPVIGRNWSGDENLDSKGRPRIKTRHNRTAPPVRYDKGGNYARGGNNQSRQNPAQYFDTKEHRKPNTVGQVIYGRFPIQVALQVGRRTFHKLYMKSSLLETYENSPGHIIHDIRLLAQERKVPIEATSQQFLNQLVDDPVQGLRQHQGVCADVSPLHHIQIDTDLESSIQTKCSRPRVWLVVQSVQDPNNFGAMMRSAHYLGVDKIITYNSCKLSPAVSKVSAGAIEVLEVYRTDNLHQLLQVCRQNNWQIFGTTGYTSTEGVTPLNNVQVNRDTLLLLGNEGEGLTEDICTLCDQLITIPYAHQHTQTALDSLNVSVASGIILYQLLSRREES